MVFKLKNKKAKVPIQEVEEEEEEEVEEEEETNLEDLPPIKPNKKNKEKTIVVKELEMRPVRKYVEEDGTVLNVITVEEYLTELANQ